MRIQHVFAIAALGLALRAQDHPTVEDNVRPLNNLGVEAHVRGSYVEALQFLSQALVNAETARIPDPSVIATTLSNLAESEMALGRLGEAQEHLERSLAMARRSFGESDPRYARHLSILGYLKSRQGHTCRGER